MFSVGITLLSELVKESSSQSRSSAFKLCEFAG
jgi:hypothetical protein